MLNLLTNFALEHCQRSDFLGLRPWWHYLPDSAFGGDPGQQCDIKNFTFLPPHSDVPFVLLAIVDDLLRIAAVVAVGFVIYGAIQYITSEGNPENTAKAQSTIINSLVGLVVAITAAAFVAFLGAKLGG